MHSPVARRPLSGVFWDVVGEVNGGYPRLPSGVSQGVYQGIPQVGDTYRVYLCSCFLEVSFSLGTSANYRR